MSDEDMPDIGDIRMAARSALMYDRLLKDVETVKAENKAMRLEQERQQAEMKKITDIIMIIMETTRVLQGLLIALSAEVSAATAGASLAIAGAAAGLDAYYISKLSTGG